jgi:hypothetical protein
MILVRTNHSCLRVGRDMKEGVESWVITNAPQNCSTKIKHFATKTIIIITHR